MLQFMYNKNLDVRIIQNVFRGLDNRRNGWNVVDFNIGQSRV